MGNQQRIHGLLRLRSNPHHLGPLGLQNGFWHLHATICRPTRSGCHHRARTGTFLSTIGRPVPKLPSRHNDLFPVCLRSHHHRHYGRCLPRKDELQRLDDIRSSLDHLLLYDWCILALGRWLPVPTRRDRLLWWLCHTFILWHSRYGHSLLQLFSSSGQDFPARLMSKYSRHIPTRLHRIFGLILCV